MSSIEDVYRRVSPVQGHGKSDGTSRLHIFFCALTFRGPSMQLRVVGLIALLRDFFFLFRRDFGDRKRCHDEH